MKGISLACLALCVVKVAGSRSPWNRPNDRSLEDVDLTRFDCDDTCTTVLGEALEEDRVGIFGDVPFDEDFYSTSHEFDPEASNAGDILKIEPFVHRSTSWDLPGGTTLYRIQYVSVSSSNRLVPATGFLAIPFSAPINGSTIPLVAYAHGTIGSFYGCAPSASYALYDYDTWRPLLLSGYAVIATDYAGLGNNYTKHHWSASTLNANDVAFSVKASQKAFPSLLSKNWVAVGHSQGGAAAWALTESGELACRDTEKNFLGAVALEPGVRLADAFTDSISATTNDTSAPSQGIAGYAYYVWAALDAIRPGSAIGLFAEKMQKRIRLAEELGVCLNAGFAVGQSLAMAGGGAEDIVPRRKTRDLMARLQSFQKEFSPGLGRRLLSPLLVIQSYSDATQLASITVKSWEAACAAGGARAELSLYPALDHSAATGGSAPEWLDWIRARFAGVPLEAGCSVVTHSAVNSNDAWLPTDF